MRTHFTWSIESPRGTCPVCDKPTVLVTPFDSWQTHEGDEPNPELEQYDGDIEVHDEVSGHFCLECWRLTSLSLNTEEHPEQEAQ